jgi:hypothetical protein
MKIPKTLICGLLLLSLAFIGTRVGTRAVEEELDCDLGDSMNSLLSNAKHYYLLMIKKEYSKAFEFLSKVQPGHRITKAEWVRDAKKLDNGIRVHEAIPLEMRNSHTITRITWRIDGETREGLFKWKPFSEVNNEYWRIEESEWRLVPTRPLEFKIGDSTIVRCEESN